VVQCSGKQCSGDRQPAMVAVGGRRPRVEAGGVLRPVGPEVARRGEQAMAACPKLIVARQG
jgi:hypothetical protein